jgi:PEP-CTERM motif
MKRFAWALAVAGSLMGAAAPAKAAQIVQAQTFNSEFVQAVGGHEHPESIFFFQSFPTASAGLGLPVTLTSAVWDMQFGLSIFFEAVNTSTIEGSLGAVMGLDVFFDSGGNGRFVDPAASAFADDTCGPAESCVGFALNFPFTQTVSASELSPFTDASADVFAGFIMFLVSGNCEGTCEGTARGNVFGTLSLTYEYAVPEPATLALLSSALAGLGFARRRKLH